MLKITTRCCTRTFPAANRSGPVMDLVRSGPAPQRAQRYLEQAEKLRLLAGAESGVSRQQGLAHVAEDQPLGRRHAVGMRRHLFLADIDVALGKQLAQMVVGTAVAEPQFEHRAVEAGDQPGRMIETSALRLEPADEAVEPAHRLG